MRETDTRVADDAVIKSKQRPREVVKYLVAVFACAIAYKLAFFWAVGNFSDGRFVTNFTLGALLMSAAFGLNYILSRFLVFRDSLKQDGNLTRYFALTLGAIVAFLGVSWMLQDVAGAPVMVARTIAGLLVIVLGWPIERFWVFQNSRRKQRRWLHIFGNVAAMLLVSAGVYTTVWLAQTIAFMYLSPVDETNATVNLADAQGSGSNADPTPATGRFTAHADIQAIGCATDGAAQGYDLVWDDDWFFGPAAEYNPELALAAGTLAAFANSESDSFNGGGGDMDVVDFLGELGFDDVQTTSYEHRSTIADNLAMLSTGATDTVAYTIASKRIASSDGARHKTLVVVAVRGSYGSEWLSDFNIAGNAPSGYEDDHVGFAAATAVVMNDLKAFLAQHAGADEDARNICVLVCGHSRGAAVSNLLAAKLDDGELHKEVGVASGDVFAYTLASPGVTLADDAHDARYDNIFNLLVPSDVVPELPLASWGYTRYGKSGSFPRQGDAGFDEADADMRTFYRASFGLESPSDPRDAQVVADAVNELAQTLPSCEGLGSLDSMCAIAHMFIYDMDASRVLASHYLPTYLAWLACAGDDGTLVFE